MGFQSLAFRREAKSLIEDHFHIDEVPSSQLDDCVRVLFTLGSLRFNDVQSGERIRQVNTPISLSIFCNIDIVIMWYVW